MSNVAAIVITLHLALAPAAVNAHSAPGQERRLLLFPAVGLAVDPAEQHSFRMEQGVARPLDLTRYAGVRFSTIGGHPALPQEFVITLSDGEEVASLTRLGRGRPPLRSSHFDFCEFHNIERLDLAAVWSIKVDFVSRERRESADPAAEGMAPVPAPAGLALFLGWLINQSRRRPL